MANIQKRISKTGKVSYRALVRIKGCPPQSATFSSITKAREWASRTENKIKDGKYFSQIKSKKFLVSDMIDRYVRNELPKKPKVMQDWSGQLRWWKEKIGNYTLADITPSLLSKVRDVLSQEDSARGKPRSSSTINRYMTTLQCVFSIAIREWELLDVNPFLRIRKLKEPRGRVRYLNDKERIRLLKECKEIKNPYLYPVVLIAISTGARKMEILSLKWSEVDLQNGRVILEETKNGERRSLSLVKEVLEVIKRLYNKRESEVWLFPSKKNRDKPFDITRGWKRALKNAQIENFRFHDLRHTSASYLAMNGASMGEIADILGHKTLQMVKRYSHLSDAHKKSVIESMNKRIFGGENEK